MEFSSKMISESPIVVVNAEVGTAHFTNPKQYVVIKLGFLLPMLEMLQLKLPELLLLI